jgi:uncharacterized membrane protein YkgB
MLMLLNQEVHGAFAARPVKLLTHATRLETLAAKVLRFGLVTLLLLFGAMKFTALEAEAIQPLVEHSPFISWVYALFGARAGSGVIGVIELSAALLICMRRWQPLLAAVGSLLAVGTFLVTVSFLVTTPGIWEPTNPFGGFILKDIVLLGAALWSSAEALRAAAQSAHAREQS